MSANQVDEHVFIGDVEASSNKKWMKDSKITHVINCTVEIPNHFSGSVNYLKLGLRDDQRESLNKVLEPTYQYIKQAIRSDPSAKILVHCHMGMSRSASIVLYYLFRRYGMNYNLAFGVLKRKRPIVRPNAGYERQLRRIMG